MLCFAPSWPARQRPRLSRYQPRWRNRSARQERHGSARPDHNGERYSPTAMLVVPQLVTAAPFQTALVATQRAQGATIYSPNPYYLLFVAMARGCTGRRTTNSSANPLSWSIPADRSRLGAQRIRTGLLRLQTRVLVVHRWAATLRVAAGRDTASPGPRIAPPGGCRNLSDLRRQYAGHHSSQRFNPTPWRWRHPTGTNDQQDQLDHAQSRGSLGFGCVLRPVCLFQRRSAQFYPSWVGNVDGDQLEAFVAE